jgi:DNA-binding transcriptional regulator YbjK
VIADAAITTIAREGLRGFTHRAVDRIAALPEGSTSYYFRTRESLMAAAMARMAELDTADLGELPHLTGEVDLESLTDLMTAVVVSWLTAGRDRTLARYELTLESTRRPALREQLIRWGSTFLVMAEMTLTAAGATEPARRGRALVSHLDGLVLHRLTRVAPGELDEAELRAACRDLLVTALK